MLIQVNSDFSFDDACALRLKGAKDTLEKEIVNDDIVVSNIVIKATPKYVFVQDKLVAAYNFTAIDVNESVDDNPEINEVKIAKLVKSCSFLLEHQKCPQ